MGVLAVVTGWTLDITHKYAEAIILADIGNFAMNEFFKGSGGYTSMTQSAMMQGGIGLLMTTLIITVPPMTMTFFRSSLGATFSSQNAFSVAGNQATANKSFNEKSEATTNNSSDPTGTTISTSSQNNPHQSGLRNLGDKISVAILHPFQQTGESLATRPTGLRANAQTKQTEAQT